MTARFPGRWWAPLLAVAFLSAEAWQVALPVLQNPGALPYPYLPTDHAAYLSFVRQGVAGEGPTSQNLFTTEAQDGRFLMLPLTATGWLVRWTGLPVPWAWHLMRLLALAGVAWALWGLVRALFEQDSHCLLAFSLVLCGGGLDAWARGLAPLGLWSDPGLSSWARNPWNFSLFWAGTVALWAWPLWVLLAWLGWEIRRPPQERGPGAWVWAGRGALFALLFALHPYTALFQGLLVAGLALRQGARMLRQGDRSGLWTLLPVALGPLAVAGYLAWALGDPVYRWSTDQVRLWRLSYPPWVWPLAYGPQVLLALAGLGPDREGERGFRWVKAWALLGVLATANPLVTGAKFQPLLIVPLGLLAARGALGVADRLSLGPRARRLGAVALVLASATSLGDALRQDFRDPATRQVLEPIAGEREAWVALAALPPGGVLCLPRTGLWVPGQTGQPVFVGQWFLSTRFGEKEHLVRWFYRGPATDDQRRGFLRAARIRYVLHGPREAEALGPVPGVSGLTLRWQGPSGWSLWEFSDPSVEPGPPGPPEAAP